MWWILPLVITIVAFVGAYAKCRGVHHGHYIDLSGLSYAFWYGAATIVSLTAWLIWSLV